MDTTRGRSSTTWGDRNIQHTVRYTELASDRFKGELMMNRLAVQLGGVPFNRQRRLPEQDLLMLDLLKHDRLPAVWIPDPVTRDLRALVNHRVRLVRIRTMVKNSLQAIALNRRLALRSKLWSQRGRAQLAALELPLPHRPTPRGQP